MFKPRRTLFPIGLIFILFILISCSSPLEWPESPLYDLSVYIPDTDQHQDVLAVKEKLVGHYAHYDVVAYVDTTTQTTMKTFIVSYGFSDFYLEDGKLMQKDEFIRANQKINQSNIVSGFTDEAVQAIKPRISEVDIFYKDGKWQLFRPATPVLLGIEGDPSKPLSEDPNDPLLIDPDNDGNPGVTVDINIGNVIKGEIYITRREIYSNFLNVNQDGSITGYVKDDSEQFVVGASLKILAQPSNSIQHPDPGMNPVILIPVDPEIDTPEELMALRDELFPPEPGFVDVKK